MAKFRTVPEGPTVIDIGTGATTRRQRHALFVVVPRFNLTTLITMIEAMRIANYLLTQPEFSWQVISFDGTPVPAWTIASGA